MPLEDLLPKSAIDELYEKYKGSTVDYITLRTELETINASLANRDANIYHDSSDITYAAANRKDKHYASIPKRIVKDRFYGIVLYKTGVFNKEVYIDVPGKTAPILDPDIFYTQPQLDLAKYKEYLFEPSSLDYYSTPVIGGIAVVKVPKNFPDHVNTNAEDAIYLHMKRPDILVTINDSGETARPPLGGGSGGGIGAINSPTVPAGGDTTVPTDGNLSTVNASAPDDGVTVVIGPYKKTDKFALPDGKITGVPLTPDERIKRPQKVVGYWDMVPGTIIVRELATKFYVRGRKGEPQYLQVPAADKLEQMMAAYEHYVGTVLSPAIKKSFAKSRMINPVVNSAFRSNSFQAQLYWEFKHANGNAADRPGTSKHQYGLAVDFLGTGVKNNKHYKGTGPFYEWLMQNAPRYGFKRTAPGEHWHWEFRYGWLDSKQGDFMSATRPLNP